MNKNKFSIGEQVKTIPSYCEIEKGRVTQIYYDEDMMMNYYVLEGYWFPLAEKDLEKEK